MAMAQLERCYNNRQVFRGLVRRRKGETVRLMMQASNMDNVKAIFIHYLKQVGNIALEGWLTYVIHALALNINRIT